MKESIRACLKNNFPQIDFTDDTRNLEDEIDSLTIVEMISCLTEEFEVEIPYDEITPDNFENLNAIVELVERIKG